MVVGHHQGWASSQKPLLAPGTLGRPSSILPKCLEGAKTGEEWKTPKAPANPLPHSSCVLRSFYASRLWQVSWQSRRWQGSPRAPRPRLSSSACGLHLPAGTAMLGNISVLAGRGTHPATSNLAVLSPFLGMARANQSRSHCGQGFALEPQIPQLQPVSSLLLSFQGCSFLARRSHGVVSSPEMQPGSDS